MPSWTKVRADLKPHDKSGFIYLDKDALTTAVNEPWVDITTYSANIGGYVNPLRCKKDSAGFVTVDGRWVCGNSVSTANLFQLPVGYRPTINALGLSVSREATGFSYLTAGDRSANTLPGLTGLSNTYAIGASVCQLSVGLDGWVSIRGNIWGEFSRVGFNFDGGYDVSGQWRQWDDKPWSSLFGRITNLRFPTD